MSGPDGGNKPDEVGTAPEGGKPESERSAGPSQPGVDAPLTAVADMEGAEQPYEWWKEFGADSAEDAKTRIKAMPQDQLVEVLSKMSLDQAEILFRAMPIDERRALCGKLLKDTIASILTDLSLLSLSEALFDGFNPEELEALKNYALEEGQENPFAQLEAGGEASSEGVDIFAAAGEEDEGRFKKDISGDTDDFSGKDEKIQELEEQLRLALLARDEAKRNLAEADKNLKREEFRGKDLAKNLREADETIKGLRAALADARSELATRPAVNTTRTGISRRAAAVLLAASLTVGGLTGYFLGKRAAKPEPFDCTATVEITADGVRRVTKLEGASCPEGGARLSQSGDTVFIREKKDGNYIAVEMPAAANK